MTSPSENDSDQGQTRGSVPRTSFSILRVSCVVVGLLLLLALIFFGWVLFTPHR